MEALRRIGRSSAVATCLWQCCAAALFLSTAERLIGLYTADLALIATGAGLLRIGGVFQLFDGLQNVGMGMLRGVLDTRVPFLAAFLSYWAVGVCSSYELAFRRHLGPQGVWYGMVLGLGCAAILHQWRFQVITSKGKRPKSMHPRLSPGVLD
jgi:MATE family multidrug resistance protein